MFDRLKKGALRRTALQANVKSTQPLDEHVAVADTENNHFRHFNILVGAGILIILAAAGLALIYENELTAWMVSRLPVTYGKTQGFFKDLFHLSIYELLSFALLFAVVLILHNIPSSLIFPQRLDAYMVRYQTVFARRLILLISALIMFIAVFILQQFPNSADEYVYLYQAETLSKGKLWETAHELEESFSFNHIASKDGISVGRFPLGWPLLLAVFLSVGIPGSLANPILAIITLFVFYRFARKLYGAQVAGWALIILSFSSFFLFNSASFFSHTSCFLETLVFVYLVYLYLDKGKASYGILAGLALGLIMLIRYYTAVLIFIPFMFILLYNHRWTAFRLFVLIGIGAFPCLVAFLLYNYAITGNVLTPVTVWGFKNEGLGFINGHSFFNGVEHVVRRFLMFAYWCSPVLLILYFAYLLQKIKRVSTSLRIPEDYLFLSFIIGYFFYYEIGGNQYGPRFYYEAFPFLILFVVHQAFQQRHYYAKLFLYAAILVMMIKLPFIAIREHGIVDKRQDLYDQVRANKITNAVVLVSSGTCDIRPMPVGDLVRNDATFQNDVLYALDNPEFNGDVMKYYPERKIYRYDRKPDAATGSLIRVR